MDKIENNRSDNFSDSHHEEVDEDISREIFDIVTNKIIVEGRVDPYSEDSNQTFEMLWTC